VIGSARRLLGVLCTSCALGTIATVAVPAAAQASALNMSACDNSVLAQPFTPWADLDYYKLAPGGDFESGAAGWSLQGGAALGADSESYGVGGSVGAASLSLPAGAVATSPQTCVNAAYPTFRFFVRSATPGTTVTESVVYGKTTIPVGAVTATGSWTPTPPLLTGSAIAGALNGGTAWVSLRFVASGGAAQVDDVYVDPWRGG